MAAVFRDPEMAERARQRLESLGGMELPRLFESGFEGNPAPDIALTNLERWLRSTSSAPIYLQQIEGVPPSGKLFLYLLGASQPIADSLIQNPELAYIVLEPDHRTALDADEILTEGRQLLSASTSYTHCLDRLRFLKQKWNLLVVTKDLTGSWPQEVVWSALSKLAEALVALTVEAVWREKGGEGPCPLMIVAFGKLAGEELNYSSDIDLVYVTPDDSVTDLTKFCEALTRAISDRMGRGALYRVDLRLRPYGSAGPAIQRMKAMESYYARYAEPWEVQALMRSKPVVGPAQMVGRWAEMRIGTCFKPKLSEVALEQMVSMRSRIQDHGESEDLKRGWGGIRDVEFLAQILQMLHGSKHEDLQTPNTLEALQKLDEHGFLEHANAISLSDGYRFLRKLEHRAQLMGDQQTHSLPDQHSAREAIANLMGCQSWHELQGSLAGHRRTIEALYRSILNLESPKEDARSSILKELGTLGSAALQWIDPMPESEAYYRALLENEGSLQRLHKVLLAAPKLVPIYKSSLPLTELLLSGEIEETSDLTSRIDRLAIDAAPRLVAETYSHAYATALTQWVLGGGDLDRSLTDLADALLKHVCQRLYAPFDVLALGSLGTCEFGPGSDADLLLLVGEPRMHREAEFQAQQLLAFISELRRLGAPVEIDLRLRPDGAKGLLVRTYEGLRNYDLEGMEMWERFALGHARLLIGSENALALVRKCAYELPLTPERLKELIRMKRRIETERVKPQHVRRNVKLGTGGLSDIEWLVHLHEMRYTNLLGSGETTEMPERIRRLGRAGLINMIEVDLLLEARRHLLDLRTRLYLMGQAEDRVPENPDRLDRLSAILGFSDGNEFLAHHEQIIDAVRRLYTEALERLRA